MRMTRSVLVVALLLLFFPHAWAQSPGVTLWPGLKVRSMKLLAPGVGWALANDRRLYWTRDNGANWADITPPSSPGFDELMSHVFFLDSQKGWALFSRFDQDETDELKYEEPKFDLASTTDAGATWTRMHLALPAPKDYGNPDKMPFQSWGGTVAFLDPLHGWMNITLTRQTMNTFSTFLLVTSDGGQTWSRAPNAPDLANVEMLLVTPSDGWMLGTSDSGQELFVTHDGTKSWNEVSVDIPKEVLPATSAVYCGLPTFEDSKQGFLQVSYSGGVGGKWATVLFATDDGGRTWKLDRMVTQEYHSQRYGRPTVVDSAWVFVAVLDHHPALRMVGAGEKIDASATGAAGVSHYSMAGQLSFATPTQGWVIVSNNRLYSTEDGGVKWTDVTPGPKPIGGGANSSLIPQSMGDGAAWTTLTPGPRPH